MDSSSSDPYEQKLYQMFQNHDPDENGLDETALIKLCHSLELNDNGNYLIKSLIQSTDSRVTFNAFKEVLLNFLGGIGIPNDDNNQTSTEIPKLVITESSIEEKFENDGPISPGREISPKLIMGSKKYGRRSRPQSLVTDSSHSDTDDDNEVNSENLLNDNKLQKVQRSSSQSEIHGKQRRRPSSGGGNSKLKRCASLPAQKKHQIQNPATTKDKLFTKHSNKEQQTSSSVESLGNVDYENLTVIINDIWIKYGKELGTNNFKLTELKLLCKRIGLFHNVADQVADEVFDKLHLNPILDRINFNQFIELINGDSTSSTITTTTGLTSGIQLLSDATATILAGHQNGGKFGKEFRDIIIGDGDGHKLLINRNDLVNIQQQQQQQQQQFQYHHHQQQQPNRFHLININNNIHNNSQLDKICTMMDLSTTLLTTSSTSSTSLNRELHVQDIPQQLETVPINNIIEMWETANITDPKLLLTNLGFDDEDTIHVGQLIKVLDEELRGSNGDTQMVLLKASLALQKAEVNALQQSFRQLYDENKKLHADNKDANKRAALLAQEIDERHANLEDSTKTEIRLLEQRHNDVIRDLTAQLASDRENWSNLNVRLEKRIQNLEQDELRLKNDIQFLHKENTTLESDQLSLQKQITNLLETNIKLNNEIIEIEDKQRHDGHINEDTEEVLDLIEKITYLQVENTNLRDKNDELTSEIENLNMELSRNNNKCKKSTTTTTATRTNNMDSSSTEILSDDPEHSSLGIKRRGDSPSKAKFTEESPRTGKLRKCNDNNNNKDNNNSESETSGDWVALNSELITTKTSSSGFSQDYSSSSDTKDEEQKILREQICKLETELNELKSLTTDDNKDTVMKTILKEKNSIESHCKELEASLDQMRKAYEDCEDYWQSKLTDERKLFEKERHMYEDEQNESDKKFNELMDKVREYEDQYAGKDGRLSPIEEKDVLEQQFAEMEAEVEETRETAQKILDEKSKEIDLLHKEIENLNMRLNNGNDITDHQCVNSSSISSGGCGLYKSTNNEIKQQSTELDSPASSPISYLWNQSTIQAPARDYQNPNWNRKIPVEASRIKNLTTSETTIFSTTPDPNHIPNNNNNNHNHNNNNTTQEQPQPLNPIQKPTSSQQKHGDLDDNSSSSSSSESAKSFESQSVASTHSIQKSSIAEFSLCSSPNNLKEELKRLKYFEVQLREQIKDLAMKRDSLVMELQQLQEAKPVLEKAYARAAHPTLIQRVNILEQKNRHLQTVLRQQQQYTESLMHQTWQQQRMELTDLRNRLETQGIIMTEQAQRLANSDLLVKDLYVENSHLSATIQRLEQQRSRVNLIHQQQQSGLSGVPGMP